MFLLTMPEHIPSGSLSPSSPCSTLWSLNICKWKQPSVCKTRFVFIPSSRRPAKACASKSAATRSMSNKTSHVARYVVWCGWQASGRNAKPDGAGDPPLTVRITPGDQVKADQGPSVLARCPGPPQSLLEWFVLPTPDLPGRNEPGLPRLAPSLSYSTTDKICLRDRAPVEGKVVQRGVSERRVTQTCKGSATTC